MYTLEMMVYIYLKYDGVQQCCFISCACGWYRGYMCVVMRVGFVDFIVLATRYRMCVCGEKHTFLIFFLFFCE